MEYTISYRVGNSGQPYMQEVKAYPLKSDSHGVYNPRLFEALASRALMDTEQFRYSTTLDCFLSNFPPLNPLANEDAAFLRRALADLQAKITSTIDVAIEMQAMAEAITASKTAQPVPSH